jgi:hypothetical protein
LKCHFCGTSLPMDPMQASGKADLRSQKNILNFCSSCNQELPRCYVCRLYMGMINPYLELNRAMRQKRINADNMVNAATAAMGNGIRKGIAGGSLEHHDSSSSAHQQPGSSSTGAAAAGKLDAGSLLDFSRWFYFCQNCCHGGHADCIDEWFAVEKHQHEEKRQLHRLLKGGGCGNGAAAKAAKSAGGDAPFSFLTARTCGVNGCNCRCKSI